MPLVSRGFVNAYVGVFDSYALSVWGGVLPYLQLSASSNVGAVLQHSMSYDAPHVYITRKVDLSIFGGVNPRCDSSVCYGTPSICMVFQLHE